MSSQAEPADGRLVRKGRASVAARFLGVDEVGIVEDDGLWAGRWEFVGEEAVLQVCQKGSASERKNRG